MDSHHPLLSFAKRVLIAAAISVLVVALAWALGRLSGVLLAIFAGVLIATLLVTVTEWVTQRTGARRQIALGCTVLVILSLLVLAGMLLGPSIGSQLQGVGEEIPRGIEEVRSNLSDTWAAPLVEALPSVNEMVPDPASMVGQITALLSMTTTLLTGAIFVFFVGVYAAADPGVYLDSMVRLVPRRGRDRAREVISLIAQALRWWFAGRLLTMAILGVLTTLGLWALGAPMPVGLGVIAGVLQFIPYLGAIAAAIPALLVGFTIGPAMALQIGILYLVVQLIESYGLTPFIQQRTISLPPAGLLSMQIIMGVLLGIPGVVLASPLSVCLVVLVQTLYVQDILGDRVDVIGDE
ncbi:MAG: AI-2E family transporter [Chthoniobacterales bacterium]